MAKIYWNSIQRGRAFDSIPSQLKGSVKALAKADVVAGKITVERYEELIGETYPAGY